MEGGKTMNHDKEVLTLCPECFRKACFSPLLKNEKGQIFCYYKLHFWTQQEWKKQRKKKIKL